jgi:hypothetical protein
VSLGLATKLVALLDAMTQADIDALPPARRERLGQLLRHWGARCDSPTGAPKAGVSPELKREPRDE